MPLNVELTISQFLTGYSFRRATYSVCLTIIFSRVVQKQSAELSAVNHIVTVSVKDHFLPGNGMISEQYTVRALTLCMLAVAWSRCIKDKESRTTDLKSHETTKTYTYFGDGDWYILIYSLMNAGRGQS
jgi:hypothetical protein